MTESILRFQFNQLFKFEQIEFQTHSTKSDSFGKQKKLFLKVDFKIS